MTAPFRGRFFGRVQQAVCATGTLFQTGNLAFKVFCMDFKPISPNTVWLLTALSRAWFKPVIFGMENLKHGGGPYLFVGNHTIYGVLDVGIYAAHLYREKGIYLRGLGDYFHFKVPVWGELLKAIGAVEGTPEECSRLMEEGHNIVVYPGGGREVCKRKGEAYKLIWKERTGFARLAIKHGYPIVPFASVGPENAYSILFDADDFLNTRLAKFLQRKGLLDSLLRNGEAVPPIARGIGPTIIPRPEKLYTGFTKPIDTSHLAGQDNDENAVMRLRLQVEQAIYLEMGRLLHYREQDKDKGLLRRFLTRL